METILGIILILVLAGVFATAAMIIVLMVVLAISTKHEYDKSQEDL